MEYKKRNGFFTFCFSFIPGAVEMYMGFMKNGVSLLATFVIMSIVYALDLPFISLVASGAMAVIWVYAFFHAWNMYRLNGNVLMGMEDRYIWTEFGLPREFKIEEAKLRRVVAIVFIFVGASLMWDAFIACIGNIIVHFFSDGFWNSLYEILDRFPRAAIAIVFICVGIRLIKGKKKELGITADTECIKDNAADATGETN